MSNGMHQQKIAIEQYFDVAGMTEIQTGFYSLASPMEALAARLFMIDAATRTLDLQYYLFKDDLVGSLIIEHLLKAAERGVQVRLLLDDLDAASKDAAFAMLAAHDNIEIKLFNPNVFRGLFRGLVLLLHLQRLGRRMHNKVMIADNKVVLFGGRNIGSEYFLSDDARMFLDYDVMAIGDLSAKVRVEFEAYWQSSMAKPLSQLTQYVFSLKDREKKRRRYRQRLAHYHSTQTAYLVEHSRLSRLVRKNRIPLVLAEAKLFFDPPSKVNNTHSEQESLVYQLNQALKVRSDLVLISPYFIPTRAGMRLFEAYRQQGVRIRVITNSLASTDVTMVYGHYRPYIAELLSMGVELYELRPRALQRERRFFKNWRKNRVSLHTKMALVDNRYLLTGSANVDPRSKKLNTEMLVVIDSVEMAKNERLQIENIMTGDNLFQLKLEAEGADEVPRLSWHYRENGQAVVEYEPPESSFWRKVTSRLMSRLPIEGVL
ncbi:MAG: phospholipase D family protein [Hydrogenovibrio sp.]|nr:phospholipase D family protein [Hydrogenovibrio sp.]